MRRPLVSCPMRRDGRPTASAQQGSAISSGAKCGASCGRATGLAFQQTIDAAAADDLLLRQLLSPAFVARCGSRIACSASEPYFFGGRYKDEFTIPARVSEGADDGALLNVWGWRAG